MLNLFNSSSKDAALKAAFKKIKDELEDHLQSINENADEIRSNCEQLEKAESKMDKLTARIEEMQLFLSEAMGFRPSRENKNQLDLTHFMEKKPLFVAVYKEN